MARALDVFMDRALVGTLFYLQTGTQLAPLYDLSSTVVYPELSKDFAMKVGDTYRFEKLGIRPWERLAKYSAPQFRDPPGALYFRGPRRACSTGGLAQACASPSKCP